MANLSTPATTAHPLDRWVPRSDHHEVHERTIDAPFEPAATAAREVAAADIRLLGPLMNLRTLPSRVLRRESPPDLGTLQAPLLRSFQSEGFVLLEDHHDADAGRSHVVMGAIGRFWSPAGNQPDPVPADEFAGYDEPDLAKTAFVLGVERLAEHRVRIWTETRIVSTSPSARRKFGAYWMLIRLPSGGIRRSWLAAIERRVLRSSVG